MQAEPIRSLAELDYFVGLTRQSPPAHVPGRDDVYDPPVAVLGRRDEPTAERLERLRAAPLGTVLRFSFGSPSWTGAALTVAARSTDALEIHRRSVDAGLEYLRATTEGLAGVAFVRTFDPVRGEPRLTTDVFVVSPTMDADAVSEAVTAARAVQRAVERNLYTRDWGFGWRRDGNAWTPNRPLRDERPRWTGGPEFLMLTGTRTSGHARVPVDGVFGPIVDAPPDTEQRLPLDLRDDTELAARWASDHRLAAALASREPTGIRDGASIIERVRALRTRVGPGAERDDAHRRGQPASTLYRALSPRDLNERVPQHRPPAPGHDTQLLLRADAAYRALRAITISAAAPRARDAATLARARDTTKLPEPAVPNFETLVVEALGARPEAGTLRRRWSIARDAMAKLDADSRFGRGPDGGLLVPTPDANVTGSTALRYFEEQGRVVVGYRQAAGLPKRVPEESFAFTKYVAAQQMSRLLRSQRSRNSPDAPTLFDQK